MTTVRQLVGLLAAEALIVAMGGCAAVTSTPWPTSGPGPLSDRMGPGEGRGAGIDGAPPELRLVAAGALPQMLFAQAMQDFATVPSPLTEAVAARPLIGGEVGPARTINGPDGPISMTLQVANAPFAQEGFTLQPAYLDDLAQYIDAGLRLVDYAHDPEGSRTLINRWVETQTHGRIPELLPVGSVDVTTRLTLVNTIYLKAPWALQFDPKKTAPASFTRADGSVEQIPTMALTDETGRILTYAQGSGWRAVNLPYYGGTLAMTFIVPDDLARFEQALTAGELAQIIAALGPREVTLTLPRFGIDTHAGLGAVLAALGMPLAFDPAQADFSSITTAERLHISAVIHEANIDVDEKGTEASAATAVLLGTMGGGPPPAPVTMRVDRPFLFLLRDTATGAILFMGRVTDPRPGG